MKFSTSAWHYKLDEAIYGKSYFWDWGGHYVGGQYVRDRKQINLCKYFWSTVWALFLYPFARVMGQKRREDWLGVGGIFYLLLAIGIAFYGLLNPYVGPISFFFPYIGTGLILAILFGGMFLHDIYVDWSDARREKREKDEFEHPRPPRGPSLTKEFLRAKKNKVCPIITWDEAPTK